MCFDGFFLRGVASTVGMAVLLSCSIKEERDECPCFLTLDFGGVAAAEMLQMGLGQMDVMIWSDGSLCDSASFRLDDQVKEYDVAVPKSELSLLAICADGGRLSGADGMVIAEGEDCPTVYLFTDSFAATGERMRRTVILRRNFCVLTVSMKTSSGVSPKRYQVTVEGSANGFGRDGQPLEGPFRSGPFPSSGGIASLRLPRQSGASARDLSLRIEYPDSRDIRTFPIGEYILESGYDWAAQDLEDISVEMDFSKSGITFTIDKWKKTISFEMTI